MLVQLSVKNFALLKHVDLLFSPKLNVLTGETGAGKSIIVDAVKLILGERANTADIRYEQEEAIVEAVFELDKEHIVIHKIEEMGIAIEDGLIILSRNIRSNGKNICRINRQIVTLTQFKEICSLLVSIYGQHDYDELGRPETRLAYLDYLGDDTFKQLQIEVAEAYKRARKSGAKVKKAVMQAHQLKEEQHQLEDRIDELEQLQLKKGEYEKLDQYFRQSVHAQELYRVAHGSRLYLYGESESLYDQLTNVIDQLKSVLKFDDTLEGPYKNLVEARIILEDVSRELGSYEDKMIFDPVEIDNIGKRLDALGKIQKKYQLSIDELLLKLEDWKEKLARIENIDDEIILLKEIYQKEKAAYDHAAERLHEMRESLAEQFSEKIIKELKDMSMENIRFEVKFEKGKGDATGFDLVDFMIAPNPGMPLRPLSETASGGEMSRVMLAIKSIVSGANDIDTLIFDEIDTGIGGEVLVAVADKLHYLSQQEQVICVTHAPVIAARAERNFFIHKEVEDGMTSTQVELLDSEEKVIQEIARMNGGHDQWQIEHARMLRQKIESH